MHARYAVCVLLLACGLVSAGAASIAGIVTASSNHTTLLEAVQAADLVATLSEAAPSGTNYTLFAPTDAAFDALPAGALDCLLSPSNKDLLTAVLLYHVLNEATAIKAAGLPATPTNYTTASGDKLLVDNVAPELNDDSTVTEADLMASNGIVHVVDAVLLPPGYMCTLPITETVASTGDHDILKAALDTADLADLLRDAAATGSFTLFAPTDDAFDALPAGALECLLLPENNETLTAVLLYHVLNEATAIMAADLPATPTNYTTASGDKLLVDNVAPQLNDDSTVTTADVMANNGIVHVVNAVLLPPGSDAALSSCTAPSMSIAAMVTASSDHTTLLAAVLAADLATTLSDPAPSGTSYTLFAPNDAAFAALPDGEVECLLLDANKDLLTKVLLYHVLNRPTAIKSTELPTTPTNFTTMSGDPLLVDNAAPQLNDDSTVVEPDGMATNGIVHEVDAVLLPPGYMGCTVPATPTPAKFKVTASSTLAGIGKADWTPAAVTGFKNGVAEVLEGVTAAAVTVTGTTEVRRRRMLLAGSLKVDYEVAVETAAQVTAAQDTLAKSDAALLTALQKNDAFAGVTGVSTNVIGATPAPSSAVGVRVCWGLLLAAVVAQAARFDMA